MITLTNAANSMAGFSAASGRDATVVNTSGLALGEITLGGNLSITANGSIIGSSPIAVGGNSQFTVTAAASDPRIELFHSGYCLSGAESTP